MIYRWIFFGYAVCMAAVLANIGLFFQTGNKVDAAMFVPALTFAVIALAIKP